MMSLPSSALDSFMAMKPYLDLSPLTKSNANKTSLSLYSHIFGFENLFEHEAYVDSLTNWMAKYWTYSFLISAVYILLIVCGRKFMASRPRYELRAPLIAWNVMLASFSILGAIRVWPEFVYSLVTKGATYSVCNNEYAYGISGFWAFMFVMSKVPELVDTLFIVARKQQLIFLHYYHHATVLVYCWYSYTDHSASGRWFMTMNYLVHGIMYSYYACKAMRLRVPVFVSQLITISQIAQMVAGVYVNWVAYMTKTRSPQTPCAITFENIKWSSIMYLSYFVLFGHFFVQSYVYSNRMHVKNKQLAAETTKNNTNSTTSTTNTTTTTNANANANTHGLESKQQHSNRNRKHHHHHHSSSSSQSQYDLNNNSNSIGSKKRN